MKTIINTFKAIILIACIITLFSVEGFGGKPQQTNNLPRYGSVGFSIGTKGYIGTGYGYVYNANLSKDFWEYNPTTDSWTQKADFGGTARYFAVGFSIGTKGYIGTGGSYKYPSGGSFLQDFWEYNPISNIWTRKADFGGIGRYVATGFSIGSKGYIGTGNGGTNNLNLNDFWEYNPTTNLWTRKTDFPGTPRYAAVGFSIGTKGYLGTGINYIDSAHYTWYNDFYEFDPNNTENPWTKKSDFGGTARAFAVGFSINNTKGYIGTGNTGSAHEGFKNDFWEYDPTNTETGGTWTQRTDFGGTKRDCAAGFSIGTKGYIGTGYITTGIYAQDFWEYNQSTNVWTQRTNFGSKHTGKPLKDALAVGETDQPGITELIVYPNPSNSTFNFRLQTLSDQKVDIKIFDMIGRLVHEYHSLSPDDIMTVGDNLNIGVFLAVVTQGEYHKTVKISKVN